jgi:TldD protein
VPEVDASFLALPRHELAAAALQRARDLGATFAEFRLERIRSESISLRDSVLESAKDDEDLGLAVRVIHDGT